MNEVVGQVDVFERVVQGVGFERVGADAFDGVPASGSQCINPTCGGADVIALGRKPRGQVPADVAASSEDEDAGHGFRVCP